MTKQEKERIVHALGRAIIAHEDLLNAFTEMRLYEDAAECDEKIKAWRRRLAAMRRKVKKSP